MLGEWAFFGRSYSVSPAVLIPRPETELLVEQAIALAAELNRPRIADVGCGSGIIAISLAAELPQAQVLALDLSRPTLIVARQNAHRHQVRVTFLQSDLLQPLKAQFNLICANLPYIPFATLSQLGLAQWEPRLALDGGMTGLDAIRRLITQARSRLAPGGVVLLETEATLGTETLAAAREGFPDAEVTLVQDLAGKDRLVEIKTP